jgi:hypothetical protein
VTVFASLLEALGVVILRAEQNVPFPVGEIVIDLCG